MDNRPKLIMMVGLAGAGKSAIAQQIANNIDAEIISSDEIRKEFCKDVNDQSKNGFVFNEMYKRAKQLLKNNKNVILDSTNLKACNRKAALEWFKHIDCIKFAYIIATPFEKCLANNKHRKRSIPEEVIKHQRETFQIPFYEEGFDAIFIDRENEDLKTLRELAEKFRCPESKKTKHSFKYYYILAQNFKDDKIKYKATFLLDYGKFFTTDIEKNGKTIYIHPNVGAYEVLTSLDYEDMTYGQLFELLFIINYHATPYYMSATQLNNLFGEEKTQFLLKLKSLNVKGEENDRD